jgi:hypothetical protein
MDAADSEYDMLGVVSLASGAHCGNMLSSQNHLNNSWISDILEGVEESYSLEQSYLRASNPSMHSYRDFHSHRQLI